MILRGIAVALVVAATATLSACGNSTVTVHGQVEPGGGALASMGADGLAQTYSGCSDDTPSPGSQVTVTNPSGKVIGSATLGTWSHRTVTADGLTMYPCWMPFTMKNVAAEQRYGFKINNVPGEIWVNNVSKIVTLDVGSTN